MKNVILAVVLAVVSSLSLAADLTGNMSLTSDYRFRGISQSQNAQALQGGVDYNHKSGLYVGNWNSSVSSQLYTNGAGVENDIYGGYKMEVMKGLTVDVGSYNYIFQRASTNGNKFDTNEVYVGVGYGPVALKYNRSLGDYFGVDNSKGSQYYQADFSYPVMSKLTAQAHVGRTKVAYHTGLNYTDYKVGAVYNLSGWDLGAHFYTNKSFGSNVIAANTINGQHLYKNAVVFSVGKSF